MALGHEVLHVSHSQFWLAELDTIESIRPEMYCNTNGLISAHDFLAIIMTGTEAGPVSVTLQLAEGEPSLDFGTWDEIVDVSMRFDDDSASVFGDRDSEGRSLPSLPPGSYRIRAHARGRDLGHGAPVVCGSPSEEHLIVAWPAQPMPEVRHKLSDAYGASLRSL